MKTNKLFSMLIVLGSIIACQEQEEVVKPSDPVKYDLTAGFETTAGLSWSWAANDEFTVYDGKDVNPFVAAEGGESATFSGLADDNAKNLMAIYPSTTGGRYYGKVNMKVLSNQDAADVFPKQNSLFAAYVEKGTTSLTFKPMTAFLKIKLSASDDVVSVDMKANADEPLSGDVKVGLFSEPTIEAAESAVANVTLSGNAMDGVFYVAVIPQTLSQGYTLTFVNSNEERFVSRVDTPVTFERNAIYDLGSFENMEWYMEPNPNPTTIPSVSIVKASFKEDEFNMVSEGSFEYFPDKPLNYRSPWVFDAETVAAPGHDGTPASSMDLTQDKFGWHRNFQVCALRQNKNYEYSAWATCTHGNTYFSCRTLPSGTNREQSGFAWGPTEEWKYISHIVNPGSDFFCEVIHGAWWESVMKAQYDQIRLIPEGYTAKSTAPVAHSVLGTISNTTFDEVSELGKIVAWKNSEGHLCFVLSDITVNGTHYDTAVALTEDSDLNESVSIKRFIKSGGKLTPVLAPGADVISIVPNDVFVLNGKTYMHYYAKTWQDENHINNWNVSHAGFLVSEDDGKTWKPGTGKWRGDGSFVASSFTQKDNWIYVLGTIKGRDPNSQWANFWMAKVDSSLDITDPSNWDYFTGSEWVHGDEWAAKPEDPIRLICGSRGEPGLVYNPKFDRFMLIYRDEKQQGLVYRDAGNIDEEWSGEKPLAYDDIAAGMYAPSVIDVTENGELLMVVPQL